jgi:hypothetical protein
MQTILAVVGMSAIPAQASASQRRYASILTKQNMENVIMSIYAVLDMVVLRANAGHARISRV